MVKRKAFGKNNKQRSEIIVIISPMAFCLYIFFVSYVRENNILFHSNNSLTGPSRCRGTTSVIQSDGGGPVFLMHLLFVFMAVVSFYFLVFLPLGGRSEGQPSSM